METIRITTSQNIDIDYEVAGLGERIAARLLDYAVFFGLYIVTIIVVLATASRNSIVTGIIVVIFLVIYGFYDLVCELAMNGQSIGKRILKIRVISIDGAQPRMGQYLLRWLFRIVDFSMTLDLCALICVAVTENKQRVGDLVAGTIVIKTIPRTNIAQIAFAPPEEQYEPVYQEVMLLNDRDIELLHEVISTYYKSNNPDPVYSLAAKIKQHLGITQREGMHELAFLQTIVKDYNYLTSRMPL